MSPTDFRALCFVVSMGLMALCGFWYGGYWGGLAVIGVTLWISVLRK